MKRIVVTIAATMALALIAATAPAGTIYEDADPIMLKPAARLLHSLAISEDGTVLLDNMPVAELAHNDIKAILSEMVAEYKKANERKSTEDYLFRQTDYLLDALQKCQDGKEERWKVIESTGTWSSE